MLKKLKRSKQCSKCPWKTQTDPNDIPNYDLERHKKLKDSCATPEDYLRDLYDMRERNFMACHESIEGNEMHCIGWLMNQLGPGNNIGLRLSMRKYDCSELETFGEQHETFEDTLPKEAH